MWNLQSLFDNDTFATWDIIIQCQAETILENAFRTGRLKSSPPMPVISIVEDMSAWGRYVTRDNGLSRVIELNETLVDEHPWYAVEEVLRHELAHFLKDCLYPYVEEPPHGRMFREMCEILGANPRASGDYPLLDEVLLQDGKEKEAESPMEGKIRKLLALSESPNEHEAHQALMKARELMGKYAVSEMSVDDNDRDPYVTVNRRLSGKRVLLQEYTLAGILNGYYDVRCLSVTEYFVDEFMKGDSRPVMAICGRLSKVKVALYVWDYIERYLDSAWKEDPNWKVYGKSVRARRDFQLGCLEGIHEVLEKQNRAPEVAALIKMDPELDKFYRSVFPRIRMRRSRYTVNEKVKEAGREAGRKLTIHHGVEENSRETKRLKE